MQSVGNVITQQFQIPTRDGRTCLRGQIDMPQGDGTHRHPAVIMVNGGWFMDRDGFMGNSGTERDLIYRDLAQDLLAVGIAVVRYDNRGVRCNEMTMPSCSVSRSEVEITQEYFRACIDAAIRQTVSVQTQVDDVEDVWNFTLNHTRVEPNRIVVWAHSEGGLNVGRLVSEKRIPPAGIIIVAGATESPVDLVRFQMVEQYAEHLMRWDADSDGRVTRGDVDYYYPRDSVFPAVGISADRLEPPSDGWTLNAALDHFAKIYSQSKAGALAKPDDASYPDAELGFLTVAASNNWWKQWFEDTKPMVDHFAEYQRHVSFHIGEIDSQSPGPRQFSFAESRIKTGHFLRPPRLVFHTGRGHSLRGGEPSAGPMDHEAKACLISEIQEILASV